MRAGFLATLVLVGLVSAGCGAAAQQADPVAAHARIPAAFAMRDLTQAAGTAVRSKGRTGVSLRAVPGSRFGLMLVLRNRTHRQLTLEDVRAVVPPGSFLRQLGTQLGPYFQCKPYCPRHLVLRGPFGVERPAAVPVRPTRSAEAQLNFAFAGCDALQSASTTPITRAIVVYRDPRGRTFRQSIALSSSQLDLHYQGRIACRA